MSETCPYCQEWRNDCNTHLERIKELEAENTALADANLRITIEWKNHLAALRQRIDDAPVVGYLHTQSNGCSILTRNQKSMFHPQDLADAEVSIYPLISKEDLK